MADNITTPNVFDLNPSQAAAVLGVSTRTVHRWIADGRLTAYKVGPRLVRIKAHDVDALAQRIAAGR